MPSPNNKLTRSEEFENIDVAARIEAMNANMNDQFSNLMAVVNLNATQMKTLQESFNTFKCDIENRVGVVENTTVENSATIRSLEDKVVKQGAQLRRIKSTIQRQGLLREFHDKKYNLKFYGIEEPTAWENNVATEANIRKFFREALKVPDADNIGIMNAHRLGRMNAAYPRTIIVRFNNIFAKEKVMNKLANLKAYNTTYKTNIYVNEHLPDRMASQRKLLIPKMKETRRKKQKYRWKVCEESGDYVLMVGGKRIDSGYVSEVEEEEGGTK